jgi:RNA polymerase sigma-70 factor, ECF subfamily
MITGAVSELQPAYATTTSGSSADSYSAWEDVYRDNVAGVYRHILSRVGNPTDAEELTADAFMATLKPLRLPAPRPQVRAYVKAAARTVLADFWRRHYGSPQVSEYSDDRAAVEHAYDGTSGSKRATAILDRLPERARKVLELRFLRGYSINEAAAELSVTPSHARVLQLRALRLAARLGSNEFLFDRKPRGGGSRADADLAIDRAQMGVDCAVTQEELSRHLAIGQPLGDEAKHHDLPLAEPGGFAVYGLVPAHIQIEDL